MKKIFAIALALVMVLSMTAAFAACPTINWACDTSVCTDGKGSVEVIPYVKGNTCGGNSWTANTCAGAINGDPVYFAVKVTVEENPNLDWWVNAKLEVSAKGIEKVNGYDVNFNGTTPFGGFGVGGVDDGIIALDTKNELKAGEYYLVYKTNTWAYVKAADFDPATDGLFQAKVKDASIAKVCFTLKSTLDATELAANYFLSVGDYFVRWDAGKITVWNGKENAANKEAVFYINSSDLIEKVEYNCDADADVEYTLTGFGFVNAAGQNVGTCDPLDWLAKAMEYLKLDFRATCYTAKAFNANFGWEDKVESCFSWSDKVQAVVDAECVVAIPKTGDASVLAWLF